jgi:AraC-like DNA-binding protein
MYDVCPPPPDLAPYVQMFWAASGEPGETPSVERIVADGCCELIVHCGAPYRELKSGELESASSAAPQPVAFVFGQLERSLLLEPTGQTDLVAVRFTPSGVGALFGVDVRTLASSAVTLDSLFGAHGRVLADQVVERRSRQERWRLLARFLRGFIGRRVNRTALLAAEVTARLDRRTVHAEPIARQLGVSWRSIERAFAVSVGLAPRQYVQIRRVSAAANYLREGRIGLTEIAASCGFVDQSHLTRTFHALVGIPPGVFAREVQADPLTIVPA